MNKQRKDRKEFIISNLINQQTLLLRGEKLKNNKTTKKKTMNNQDYKIRRPFSIITLNMNDLNSPTERFMRYYQK